MSNDKLNDLEKRVLLLEDEKQIRDLVSAFADGVTRGDHSGLPRLFDEHAKFQIHHPANLSCNGVDETLALIKKLSSGKDFFVQFVHSGKVAITNDTAEGRFLIHEAGMGKPSSFYNTYVIVNDKYRKDKKGWVFTERAFDYMWLDTKPFNGEAYALPKIKSR